VVEEKSSHKREGEEPLEPTPEQPACAAGVTWVSERGWLKKRPVTKERERDLSMPAYAGTPSVRSWSHLGITRGGG